MMIRTKLVLGFLGISLLVSGIGMVALVGMNNAEEAFTTYDQKTVEELRLVDDMNYHLQMTITSTGIYVITDNPVYREQASHHLAALNETEQTYLQQPDPLQAAELQETHNNVQNAVTTALRMYEDDASNEAVIGEIGAVASTNSSAMTFYQALSDDIKEEREAAATTTYAAFNTAAQLTLAASMISLLLGSIFGLVLSRRISRPLNRLQKVIHDISRGNMDVEISTDLKQREDEIGGVAQAFDRTLTSLKLAMHRTAPELEEKMERTEQEKRVLETERKELLSLLEATLDVSSDGILITDTGGNFRRYNQRFIEMWNLPEDDDASQNADAAVQHVKDNVENPDEFAERVQYLIDHETETEHKTIRLVDDRVIERYTQPLTADGDIIGRVWRFRERTESGDER